MSFRNNRHPRLVVHGKHMEFLGVVRCGNHRDLAQPLGHAVIHIVRVAVPQIVLHIRVLLPKRRNPLRKKPRRTALNRCNVERSLKPLLNLLNFLLGLVHQVENLRGVLQKQLALLRQGDLMRRAHKKLRAKLLLQVLYLTA